MKQFKISDEEIKQMYLSGKSLNEIARVAQDTKGLMTLRKRLLQMGVSTKIDYNRYAYRMGKRTYLLNEELFDNIDSADKAYWLGFLFADGYNQEDRNKVEIVLQSLDEEHLKKFQQFLSTNIPVKHYTMKGYDKVQISVSSYHMSRALAQLGCVKAKTRIRKYPNIPSEFNRDFIRGYFDGNGCICHSDKDNSFQLTFTGNLQLMVDIQKILEEEINLNHLKLNTRKDKTSVSLHYSGRRVCGRILDYMYEDANTFLDRKFNKYCKLYLGGVTRNNNKPREFRETPTSMAGDNPEPSLFWEEGATTIPKGSTLKRVEVRGSEKSDDDIV